LAHLLVLIGLQTFLEVIAIVMVHNFWMVQKVGKPIAIFDGHYYTVAGRGQSGRMTGIAKQRKLQS
jgi:predicted ABC-type sugar transport system permease subunit